MDINDSTQDELNQKLYDFILKNDLKRVEWFLKAGAEPNFDNFKCLENAAYNCRFDICKLLIEHGANPHAANENTLRMAAEDGVLEMVKYLVEEHNCDIHAEDEYAIGLAASNGFLDVVMYLIEKGADVNADGAYPLLEAAENGHYEIVYYLLENGIDFEMHGVDALERAIGGGDEEIVELLIARGVNVHDTEYENIINQDVYDFPKVKYVLQKHIRKEKIKWI
jgi:ankyrin repeat protein